MDIVTGKIKQAQQLLDEFGIDLWLLFVRETSVLSDPVMPLMVGHDVVWPSFFVFTRTGEAIALVGNLDGEDFVRSGCFTEVLTYTEGVSREIRRLISRLDPDVIGINYSRSNSTSDGITYGMYLLLKDYLEGTPFGDRLVTAEDVCSRIRSRKTELEIQRIVAAEALALRAWDAAVEEFTPGMTEIEIAAVIDHSIADLGGEIAFETIANAGDKTRPGHGKPTDARLEPGDLLHVDFGARLEGYCSDIQRLVYFRRPGEAGSPAELTRAFDLVNRIIGQAGALTRPGVRGVEIDAVAREMLRTKGYDEYQHALGHQLGRSVHDGGALIGPPWERYGPAPTVPLEAGNVFTLELEIILPGTGCVGLEEDVCVTEQGARFLGPRQLELIVK
jgi:Xaa-Pro aminopeptidase